jgi:YHS domain-containing protein
MAVEPVGNPTTTIDDTTWWFCSTHCHDEFTNDPDRFRTPSGTT